MIQNLRPLVIATVLVSVLLVSSAQAQESGVFEWEEGTQKVTGTAAASGGNQVFTFAAGKVECNEVALTAPVPGGLSSSTLATEALTYNQSTKGEDKCIGPLGTSPKMEMNGCSYRFHAGTTINEETTLGWMDIVCPEGKKIVMNAPGCLFRVGAQEGLGPVFYRTDTSGNPDDVVVELRIGDGFEHNKRISYVLEGFLCGSKSEINGTYTGNITVRGENKLGQQTGFEVT